MKPFNRMIKQFPQCAFLNEDGKRCRRHSAIQHDLHLESELYNYPAWVRVNLCPEHFIHFRGTFLRERKEKIGVYKTRS
jgi:hypothetical protein